MSESKDNVLNSFETYTSGIIISLFSIIDNNNQLTADNIWLVLELLNYYQFTKLMKKAIKIIQENDWYAQKFSVLFDDKYLNGPYRDYLMPVVDKVTERYINFVIKKKETISETIEELVIIKNEQMKTKLLTKCLTKLIIKNNTTITTTTTQNVYDDDDDIQV